MFLLVIHSLHSSIFGHPQLLILATSMILGNIKIEIIRAQGWVCRS